MRRRAFTPRPSPSCPGAIFKGLTSALYADLSLPDTMFMFTHKTRSLGDIGRNKIMGIHVPRLTYFKCIQNVMFYKKPVIPYLLFSFRNQDIAESQT